MQTCRRALPFGASHFSKGCWRLAVMSSLQDDPPTRVLGRSGMGHAHPPCHAAQHELLRSCACADDILDAHALQVIDHQAMST